MNGNNIMLTTIVGLLLACTPRQNVYCTREIRPVCANGTTYNNLCLAEAAGYYGDCAYHVKAGECGSISGRATCPSGEFMSEKGMCVRKPWSDFESCEIEKNQGACPGGRDPNPWVSEHCAVTCGVYTRSMRTNDAA